MLENFCSDIIQTMKCFSLESFNLSCQAEHIKINSRLNFNPGLVLIAFRTTRPWSYISICTGPLKAGRGEGGLGRLQPPPPNNLLKFFCNILLKMQKSVRYCPGFEHDFKCP